MKCSIAKQVWLLGSWDRVTNDVAVISKGACYSAFGKGMGQMVFDPNLTSSFFCVMIVTS